MFRSIWLHSGPFGYLTKLGAKLAELVQNVLHERTQSTPLDPKLMFWCIFHTIWVHSGPFGCHTKLGAKRAELVQKFVPRSRVGLFFATNAPDPPQWTLN